MPTINDLLRDWLSAYLARPDIIENINALEAASRKKPPDGYREPILVTILRGIYSPPSLGYERLLVESGYGAYSARAMTAIIVRVGRRTAYENQRRRAIFDAIRFLAGPCERRSAIISRARALLEAWTKTSIIETVFDEAHLGVQEFIRLLEFGVDGREISRQRIREIAAAVLPHLSISRGPKISAASAAHEFFLQENAGLRRKRRAPSRYRRAEEYVGAVTEATRLEFGDASFDQRPARRRIKRAKNAIG